MLALYAFAPHKPCFSYVRRKDSFYSYRGCIGLLTILFQEHCILERALQQAPGSVFECPPVASAILTWDRKATLYVTLIGYMASPSILCNVYPNLRGEYLLRV